MLKSLSSNLGQYWAPPAQSIDVQLRSGDVPRPGPTKKKQPRYAAITTENPKAEVPAAARSDPKATLSHEKAPKSIARGPYKAELSPIGEDWDWDIELSRVIEDDRGDEPVLSDNDKAELCRQREGDEAGM